MYDVRQFKPALYLLLVLGIIGFAMAADEVGMLVLALAALGLNALLVFKGRFQPMPRIVASIVTILALLYVLREVFLSQQPPVIVVGEFLVLLQVIKLYEQRGNRDYAQLLVLGLLLMVAAAISTPSFAFGLLLIVYLFLSLYCCLLFHLKVEADAARRAISTPDLPVSTATFRQDQRFLPRSMRRLTLLVALTSVFFGVIVFLLFPRDTGAGILGPMQLRSGPHMTGFSDHVALDQVARIQQDTQVIAYVRVWKNGQPVSGREPLLLRGMTLDHYNTSTSELGPPWQWSRSPSEASFVTVSRHNDPVRLTSPDTQPGGDEVLQRITLQPTGTNVLFAVAGAESIASHRPLHLRYSQYDGILQTTEPLMDALDYEVVSRDSLDPPADAGPPSFMPWEPDPKILAYAQRPEVCGVDKVGVPLARNRQARGGVDPLDGQIASNIEQHLRNTFAYTLDLTHEPRKAGVDPLVEFLYNFKKGHCEYFAGAMTRLCQSLGMQARLVVGFRCDEFNDYGGHYIVRQSDAHAWVEVHTSDGWKSYDPTSSNDAATLAAHNGFLTRVRHMLDFVEFTYANSVIAYDNDERAGLIQGVETQLIRMARWRRSLANIQSLFNSVTFWKLSSNLIGLIVYGILMAGVVALLVYLREKWTLRRRARRIGISALPPAEQLRLARQLGFYDDLLLMLGRHRIERQRHLTPMEFADSLLYLPSDAYNRIRRLTHLFYRVRYGAAELSTGQQRHLNAVIAQIERHLQTVSGM